MAKAGYVLCYPLAKASGNPKNQKQSGAFSSWYCNGEIIASIIPLYFELPPALAGGIISIFAALVKFYRCFVLHGLAKADYVLCYPLAKASGNPKNKKNLEHLVVGTAAAK